MFNNSLKYFQGTVKQLQDLTGWSGHQVLYFGDHPYSDLADVTLEHGWRTGAIINELTVCLYIFIEILFWKSNSSFLKKVELDISLIPSSIFTVSEHKKMVLLRIL